MAELCGFASQFDERRWAIEAAAGVGLLLAQQFGRAGIDIIDVPASLGARVRLLGSGRTSKTDRNDAHSIAVAAIRHPRLRSVEVEDHMAQIRVLVDRQMHLSASRIKAASRLHALLREVLPGGARRGLRAHMARTLLEELEIDHPADETRRADIERIEDQMNAAKRRLAREVNASNTTLPELLGCGPITAAMILSRVRNVNRPIDGDIECWRRPETPKPADRRER